MRRAHQRGSLAEKSPFLTPGIKCTAAAHEPILEESKGAAVPYVRAKEEHSTPCKTATYVTNALFGRKKK